MQTIRNQKTFKFFPRMLGIFAIVCTFLLHSSAWAQTNWTKVPGAALDIGAGGGKIWALGTDGNILPYNPHPSRVGNPWDPFALPTPGSNRVAVDGDGNAWVIDGQQQVHRFDGVGQFLKIPGAALDIGAGGGKVWVIGTDGNMYPYNPHPSRVGNPWDPFAPPAAGCNRVAVDGDGNAWVVDGQQQIWRFDGVGSFQKIPGQALDIGAGGGRIWAIGTDGNIYPYNPHPSRVGNPWDPFAPPAAGCTSIAVDGDGNAWVVDGQKQIYRFTQ